MTTIKLIHIDDIIVNVLNPRYEPQQREVDEMNLIINKEKIIELIKDISEYGLDPSENLIVSYDEELGSYIAEEGNRRITAVKILNDPNIIPSFTKNRDKIIKKVNEIKQNARYKFIDKINCVIINDENSKKHFIELKHTGENNGAGRRKWNRESQLRFKSNDRFGKYLLNFIKTIHPKITDNFGITTFDRIISDPDMRSAIGIVLDRKKPEIKLADNYSKLKIHFILDGLLTKKFNVNDFRNKSDRQLFSNKYLLDPTYRPWLEDNKNTESEISITNSKTVSINEEQSYNQEQLKSLDTVIDYEKKDEKQPKEVLDKKDPSEMQQKKVNIIDDSTVKNNSFNNNGHKREYNRRQKEPKNREYPFKGINYTGKNIGISRSLFELHRMDVKTFPLSTTVLIRTLLECTIQEYITIKKINIKVKNDKSIKDLSIDSLLKECTDNSKGNLKALESTNKTVARILREGNQKRDPDELNIVAHGNYREPSVNAIWDIERRWYHAIKIMIDEITSGQLY